MHDVFQRFVDRIIARPDIATLGDALAEVLMALDIPSYAYLLLPAGSATTQLISNYPAAWTAHYLASRYEGIDPVVLEAQKTLRSFAWGSGARPDNELSSQAGFFEEAARFGIC